MQQAAGKPAQMVQLIGCPVTVESWELFQRSLLRATKNEAFEELTLPISWRYCYWLAEEMEGLPYTRSVVQALRSHYFRKLNVE